MNQAVTAALEREEAGNQAKQGKKRKYNASYVPEDYAAIGRYAAKIEGVACPLGNLQSLKSQSGLYSAICNRLTTQSKPDIRIPYYAIGFLDNLNFQGFCGPSIISKASSDFSWSTKRIS